MLISLVVGLFIALAMFLMGLSLKALKKLVSTIISFLCSLLNKIGIKINYRERNLKVDKNVFRDYKEIKEVKRGALGMRKKRSINVFALILLFIAGGLIIANLKVVSGNMITNWLTDVVAKLFQGKELINNIDMNTIYTASVFSVLSFALTKLLTQWKETAEIRKERKHQKRKKALLAEMTSQELIDEAEKKDKERIEKENK